MKERKFQLNRRYKSKCMIFTPSGIVKKGTSYSGREWVRILGFEVGDDNFKKMFGEVSDKRTGVPRQL